MEYTYKNKCLFCGEELEDYYEFLSDRHPSQRCQCEDRKKWEIAAKKLQDIEDVPEKNLLEIRKQEAKEKLEYYRKILEGDDVNYSYGFDLIIDKILKET